MAGTQRRAPVAYARGVHPFVMPQERGTPRLIVRDPVPDAVTESSGGRVNIVGEGGGRIARCPAAAVLQALRQIPVIKRGPGLQTPLEHPVDQPGIEVEALGVGCALAPAREESWPGDREAVRVQPEIGRELQVCGPAVIVIARHRAARAVADPAWLRAEAVPDRFAAAVDRGGPFDLVGGSGATPAEPGWELAAHQARGGICGRDRHEPSVGCLPLRFACGRSRRARAHNSFGRYVTAVMESFPYSPLPQASGAPPKPGGAAAPRTLPQAGDTRRRRARVGCAAAATEARHVTLTAKSRCTGSAEP